MAGLFNWLAGNNDEPELVAVEWSTLEDMTTVENYDGSDTPGLHQAIGRLMEQGIGHNYDEQYQIQWWMKQR